MEVHSWPLETVHVPKQSSIKGPLTSFQPQLVVYIKWIELSQLSSSDLNMQISLWVSSTRWMTAMKCSWKLWKLVSGTLSFSFFFCFVFILHFVQIVTSSFLCTAVLVTADRHVLHLWHMVSPAAFASNELQWESAPFSRLMFSLPEPTHWQCSNQ